MQVGQIKLPCGCEARKEIMFVAGKPGITEAMILTTAALAVIAAIIYAKSKG